MGKASDVERLIEACELRDGDDVSKAIVSSGIMCRIRFDAERIAKHRDEIKALLSDFNDNFYVGRGDGWSFLNFFETKDGIHWGEHRSMDLLCCLGIAAGFVEWFLPREMWGALPGHMPYLVIDLDKNMAQFRGSE